MRLMNDGGRLALAVPGGIIDVARASNGLFQADPQAIFARWDELRDWVEQEHWRDLAPSPLEADRLGPPTPHPGQIVAIGLNYVDHARESGHEPPQGLPPVFTKFATAITGPNATVALPEGKVDWEVELAVVIGRRTHRISASEGWDAVAGVMVAQDLSERVLQLSGVAPQFSLGKSYPGFLPLGPALVSVDELPDRDALRLTCELDGEVVQDGSTAEMIMPVAPLIAELSQVLVLNPGDVILTGTPAGVGLGRTPPRFLQPGQVLTSTIEGIGTIRQQFVAR